MTRADDLLASVLMFNIELKHFYTNKTSYYTGNCIDSDIPTFDQRLWYLVYTDTFSCEKK